MLERHAITEILTLAKVVASRLETILIHLNSMDSFILGATADPGPAHVSSRLPDPGARRGVPSRTARTRRARAGRRAAPRRPRGTSGTRSGRRRQRRARSAGRARG